MTKEMTRIEKRLYELLKDGEPHKVAEMIPLVDDRASKINVQLHLSYLRKKIKPKGLAIVCVIHNRTCHYRMMRPLYPEE